MHTREAIETLEDEYLATYAVKSRHSEGRVHPEEEHLYRSRFQRDRDRVIHSRAFRRLEYKTQVFVNHEGDYYRTRLTHSLEVAQIARSIARALRLNEDLAEAISLAHDLGHTPFGHAGQDVMNDLMKDHGGFEHNAQSFRVVTYLEDRYPEFPGLNLTYELLEGITKHTTSYDMPSGDVFKRKGYPSLEAQICNLADEIAYNNHDIDDGLKSSMITLDDLRDVALWQEHYEKVLKKYPSAHHELQIAQTVKSLINTLVSDVCEQILANITDKKITSLDDVRNRGKNCVEFSPKVRKQTTELKRFLYQKLYRHYRVIRMADKACRIMRDLFSAYLKNPEIIPPDFMRRYHGDKKIEIHRIICDYIAGMTDRFAINEHAKLFDPRIRV